MPLATVSPVHATDLPLLRTPGRPVLTPDGRVFVGLSWPDLAADHSAGVLHRLSPSGPEPLSRTAFTAGPRDSDPVVSADGGLLFRRTPAGGPAQVWLIPVDGGEARQLTDQPSGVRWARFLADGRVVFTARVPEPGRYGTADGVGPDAEPARALDRLSYRSDGEGFVLDRPVQAFLVDPSDWAAGDPPPVPVQVTDEPAGVREVTVDDDGAVLYTRVSAPDATTTEIARVAGPHLGRPEVGTVLVPSVGNPSDPVVAGDRIYFVAAEFVGADANGRTAGLWWAPIGGGDAVRMTDPETVQLERSVGPPVVVPGGVLVAVQHRGTVGIRLVPDDAARASLEDLPVVLAGPVVSAFSASPAPMNDPGGSAADEWIVAAVVSDTRSAGEVVTVRLSGEPGTVRPDAPARWTDWSAELRASGLLEPMELTGSGADGYPVHGWLLVPEGEGPHPVLLVVHGGPHAAYTPAVFDEVQVYAAAGYAVVFGNPRGSAGYGEEHGRTVLGRLGTVDKDDVLTLLDLALARPECDGDRVGVMGGSYGGFMTSWLASHAPERFVAGISERAVNAWDSFAGSSDIGYHFATSYVGADRDTRWRMSPLAYADEIAVPLFIIHSEQDWRCPVEQAQRLFVELKLRGAETQMLLFPGEGHELSRSGRPRHRLQRFEAILAWWQRHLPVG